MGNWKSILGKAHESDYKDAIVRDIKLKLMIYIRKEDNIFKDLFDRSYDIKCEDRYKIYHTATDIDPTKK